jgi:hypothetical protein
MVLFGDEADLVDVEGLGAIDVGHGDCDELETEDHEESVPGPGPGGLGASAQRRGFARCLGIQA